MGLATWLYHSCFSWRVRLASSAELADADVIMAHEFGNQHDISAASAAMGRSALLISRRYHKPVVLQHPLPRSVPELTPVLIIREHRVRGAYLDTEEVQGQLAQFCRRQGWRKVILCCHPRHAWRAGQNLRRHGLVPVYADNRHIRCDPRCSRVALRWEWLFLLREIAAKLYYFRRGFISDPPT